MFDHMCGRKTNNTRDRIRKLWYVPMSVDIDIHGVRNSELFMDENTEMPTFELY